MGAEAHDPGAKVPGQGGLAGQERLESGPATTKQREAQGAVHDPAQQQGGREPGKVEAEGERSQHRRDVHRRSGDGGDRVRGEVAAGPVDGTRHGEKHGG